MNNSKSWAQGSRFYEQLRIVDDMNDTSSRPLLTWKTPSHDLMALD